MLWHNKRRHKLKNGNCWARFLPFCSWVPENPNCPVWWHPHSSSSFCVSHHGNCLSSFFPACHSPSLVQPQSTAFSTHRDISQQALSHFLPFKYKYIHTHLMAFRCWHGEGSTYHLILPFNFSSDLLVACLALGRSAQRLRFPCSGVVICWAVLLTSGTYHQEPLHMTSEHWKVRGKSLLVQKPSEIVQNSVFSYKLFPILNNSSPPMSW